MPIEVVRGFAFLKKAAAFTNCELGVLDESTSTGVAVFALKLVLLCPQNQYIGP